MPQQNRLPIKAARDIADNYGWDQVIIVARKVGDEGYEHVVTYGAGRAHCEASARAGNAIKHHLMRWPSSLFDSALRIVGVGRLDNEHPRALVLHLNQEPSDHDIRMIHDMLSPPTVSPKRIDAGE